MYKIIRRHLGVIAMDARGSVYLLQGGAEGNFFGVGRCGAGAKYSRQGWAKVKLGAFSGQGGTVLKICGAGAVRGSFFPGLGRGRTGRASLVIENKTAYKTTRFICILSIFPIQFESSNVHILDENATTSQKGEYFTHI